MPEDNEMQSTPEIKPKESKRSSKKNTPKELLLQPPNRKKESLL